MRRLGPAGEIEKIAAELEEMAIAQGALADVEVWSGIRSKSKRIQVLSRRPSVVRKKVEVDLVCRQCDLKMAEEESVRGKYRDFKCVGCGIWVGGVWGPSTQKRVAEVQSVEEA